MSSDESRKPSGPGKDDQPAGAEAGSAEKSAAEAVVFNIGDEAQPAHIPEIYLRGLNNDQKEAVTKILANEVFYLWGPPGTGKTATLSALCLALVDQAKRFLLCSNTNQAVDQVLLKLCERLGGEHPAIADGRIVRVGQITHSKLKGNWSEDITVDGIAERKSRSLLTRKGELELQLERLQDSINRAAGYMKLFSVLDGLVADHGHAAAACEKAGIHCEAVIKRKWTLEQRLESLASKRQRVQTSGFIVRLFLRSLESIEKDIEATGAELSSVGEQAESAAQELCRLKERAAEIDSAVREAGLAVADLDRKQVEGGLRREEEEKGTLIKEITGIGTQLEDIRRSVIGQALVVGATVTRTFLSPQQLGSFDVVIVDEASMVMLPALFTAAGLAENKVVISGDFRQLAPIIQTDQKAILEAIGGDVFRSSGVAYMEKGRQKRLVMLKEQYRMDDRICRLISSRMYNGQLRTAAGRKPAGAPPPQPFDGALTIVDTSPLGPFVNRDPYNSRYNLINALAVRNLCRFFEARDYLAAGDNGNTEHRVGICTPYAAQCKVLQRILEGSGLTDRIETGTVHRYQGDEKQVIILDIPDSCAEPRVGMFLEADAPGDPGALLFNVAVSRAKDHLIVFANLEYLDRKLPAYAILRHILHEMENRGRVIDVRDVLALHPAANEQRGLGRQFDLSPETARTGLFRQKDFEQVCFADMEQAGKSIAVFSGFVTQQRAASYAPVFRCKKAQGVAVRCVTRPPGDNGGIPFEQGKAALDGLEQSGCIVDTRGEIHEKAVIIDNRIVWFGSLNPLSHTSRTDEIMARVEGKAFALQVAGFLALDGRARSHPGQGVPAGAENPRCPVCGSRTAYYKGPPRCWECEQGDWKENIGRPRGRKKRSGQQAGNAPPCSKCGSPMLLRNGKHGEFYGCAAYPACSNTAGVNNIGDSARDSGRALE